MQESTQQEVKGTVNTWDNGDVAYGCAYPIALIVFVIIVTIIF